jgi:hypothetical protein
MSHMLVANFETGNQGPGGCSKRANRRDRGCSKRADQCIDIGDRKSGGGGGGSCMGDGGRIK